MAENTEVTKPNCRKCKWRGTIPGSCHSQCCHPETGMDNLDPLANMMAKFASVRRGAPRVGHSALKLGVTGNPTGIRKGWFNWPWNFDPVWLESCNGFEAKVGDDNG